MFMNFKPVYSGFSAVDWLPGEKAIVQDLWYKTGPSQRELIKLRGTTTKALPQRYGKVRSHLWPQSGFFMQRTLLDC